MAGTSCRQCTIGVFTRVLFRNGHTMTTPPTNSWENISDAVVGMRFCGNIQEPNTDCKDCEEQLSIFIASEREEAYAQGFKDGQHAKT